MRAYRKLKIERFDRWGIAYLSKYHRDRRNEQNNQPHATLRWQWFNVRVGTSSDGKSIREWQLRRLGCDCKACMSHLELLSTLNPERYMSLRYPPVPDEPIFYKPKQLHASVAARRRQAKTINRFAIQ